jgi:hypothetical protein
VQEQIVSKLSLAAEAVEARNYRDGEALCNEILTLDPSCSEAFFLKARAIGWQSRIGALRLDDAAALFRDAIGSGALRGMWMRRVRRWILPWASVIIFRRAGII